MMKKRVLCFGDSNTYCVHPHDPDFSGIDRLDDGKRWTDFLAGALGEDYEVIVEGLKGRTTVFDDPVKEGMSGLQYLVPCVLSQSPLDLLLIMLGTNDTKQIYGATAGNIADGMARLIRTAQNTPCWREKPNILVVSPVCVGKDYKKGTLGYKYGDGSYEKMIELPHYYQKVAEQFGCGFLDAAQFVTVNEIDYIHMKESEQHIFGKEVAKKVREMA